MTGLDKLFFSFSSPSISSSASDSPSSITSPSFSTNPIYDTPRKTSSTTSSSASPIESRTDQESPMLDYFAYQPLGPTGCPLSPIDLVVATFDKLDINNHQQYKMNVNILKLQTQVAYSPQRPVAQPLQASSSASSTISSSASSSTSSFGSSPSNSERRRSLRPTRSPTPAATSILKCTRCSRSVSVDSNSPSRDVISFGPLNYCSSCTAYLERRAADLWALYLSQNTIRFIHFNHFLDFFPDGLSLRFGFLINKTIWRVQLLQYIGFAACIQHNVTLTAIEIFSLLEQAEDLNMVDFLFQTTTWTSR